MISKWYRHPLIILALLLIIFFLPVYLAQWAFRQHLAFGHTTNYGELLQPAQELIKLPLITEQGKPVVQQQLSGKWLFLLLIGSHCTDKCTKALYNMRQVRLATGKDMQRIQRVIVTPLGLQDTKLDQLLSKEYQGTWHFQINASKLPLAMNYLYLVDPHGLIILRYALDVNPTNMLKDVERLLKFSQIG